MRLEHVGVFTESQLPIIVQKCARPTSNMFSLLAPARQGNIKASDMFSACPLCPFSWNKGDRATYSPSSGQRAAEDLTDACSKTIQDHLASHLELIALLSLPERDDLDDADSDKRQSDVEDNREKDDIEQDDDNLSADSPDELDILLADGPLEECLPLDEYLMQNGWTFVFDAPRVRFTRFPEQGQDPTLQEFVKRARYLQVISTWKDSQVPVIIIHDPEGLEIEMSI